MTKNNIYIWDSLNSMFESANSNLSILVILCQYYGEISSSRMCLLNANLKQKKTFCLLDKLYFKVAQSLTVQNLLMSLGKTCQKLCDTILISFIFCVV